MATTTRTPAPTGTAAAPAGPPRRRSRRAPWRKIGAYALLVLTACAFIGPFVLLLSTSLKPADQSVFSYPPDLLPRPPVLRWFVEAWTTIPYGRFLLNSVLYVGVTVPVYLAVSALTAYPLARIRFRGRQVFFILFLSTMFLPSELMIIPRFLVMKELRLLDSYPSVILPSLLSALGIFLLRQTFAAIPDEIVEAARMDGASEWRIFRSIALPVARPTLAVLAILGFVSVWNSFLWPLVALDDQSKFPIALGIAYLTGISGTDTRTLSAGTLLSLVPIVVFFLLLQRQILEGAKGAVKG